MNSVYVAEWAEFISSTQSELPRQPLGRPVSLHILTVLQKFLLKYFVMY